jgi:hypothetical protein
METVETAGESWCVSFVWTSGVGKVNELPSLLVAGGMLRFDLVLSYARIHIKANALSEHQRVSGERFDREVKVVPPSDPLLTGVGRGRKALRKTWATAQ